MCVSHLAQLATPSIEEIGMQASAKLKQVESELNVEHALGRHVAAGTDPNGDWSRLCLLWQPYRSERPVLRARVTVLRTCT